MKDCVFVVADKEMKATFDGFFERPALQRLLQIRRFTYDIFSEPTKDPGVYTKAHELVRSFQKTHRHAMVVLDEEWSGSPRATKIRQHILGNIHRIGWPEDRVAVVVIVPELEAWILQDRPHFHETVKFTQPSLRSWLATKGHWREGDIKAHAPKEAIEALCRDGRVPRSSVLYRQIASQISFQGCIDGSFLALCAQLRTWFPAEANQ
jgi:hypothetical protein